MRSLLAIPTFATFTACASAGNTAANSEASHLAEGTYQFVATLPGQHVRGTMRVDADTMIVDTETRDCRSVTAPRQGQVRTEVFRFGCTGGVMFTFDRRNPVRSSTWTASVPVRRRRQVCAERAVRDGREVCIRQEFETYETTESRSGMLQVRRVQ